MAKIKKSVFLDNIAFENNNKWTKENLEYILSTFNKLKASHVEFFENEVEFFKEEEETDQEYKDRLERESIVRKTLEEIEYKKYLKLKQKFEK